MRRGVFFGLLLIMFAGCGPADLINLPTSAPRITILCSTESGEKWSVLIAPTFPSTSLGRGGLPGAKVTLYDNGSFLEVLKRDTTGMNSFPTVFRSATNTPTPGHDYEIVVEHEDYPTASAKFTQPKAVPAEIEMSFKKREWNLAYVSGSINRIDTAWSTLYNVDVTFTDPPGENFYDFQIVGNDNPDTLRSILGYYMFSDEAYFKDFHSRGMMDDKNISERKVTIHFEYRRDEYSPIVWPNPYFGLQTWFRVSLRTMTKDQYKYILQADRSQKAEYDPYAQPVTTFTNIQNGVGIFGGYTPSSKIFHFPYDPSL